MKICLLKIFHSCYSSIGSVGGVQDISLGWGCDTTRGTPVHEIMHALGFMHEHQRYDKNTVY